MGVFRGACVAIAAASQTHRGSTHGSNVVIGFHVWACNLRFSQLQRPKPCRLHQKAILFRERGADYHAPNLHEVLLYPIFRHLNPQTNLKSWTLQLTKLHPAAFKPTLTPPEITPQTLYIPAACSSGPRGGRWVCFLSPSTA